MPSDSHICVATRQRLEPGLNAPMQLSFTRFVAAHGGINSLRASEMPPQTVSCNPLTFARLPGLLCGTPGHAGTNGETV
jgi:hypothetical protein